MVHREPCTPADPYGRARGPGRTLAGFDLIFVALASALEVCALLTGLELPLETVVVAVTVTRATERAGRAPVAGLLHSPVSPRAATLHKLMPRHCS